MRLLLYVLALIGFIALFYFLFHFFFASTGSTMFTSAPTSVQAYAAHTENQASFSSVSPAAVPARTPQKRMLVRNATLTLQVSDVNSVMQKINTLAESIGGYVVNSNVAQDVEDNMDTNGQISIRVPSTKLNDTLTRLKSYALKVLQESIQGEDITEQYVNLESQLKNLEAAKVQLTKIMQGATQTADVLQVYQQLHETQKQIDVLTGQMKYYKESLDLSLVTIYLQKDPLIKKQQMKHWQLGETVKSSYYTLLEYIQGFTRGLTQFIVFLPLIVLWLIIAILVIWIGKIIYSRFIR
ncbi:DUF4349 domain-containing protein [Legionella septentrionalis]|uniref:DUF4349 domain-containing protein n=1 Tax=Legionella septentrionalis TaxID=2498109 RepID=UPI000F8D6166|nr:DUF4349 domain-containing protein [Legionella septentrionalis]RUR14667.1 DUF4349 domain-containing protein [Legionella septentrionalis]